MYPPALEAGPALSVVIPTIGMHDVLGRVLDRFERQSAQSGSFEVIVVADAAEPDPAAVERVIADRPYPVRMLTGSRPGASANRNAGWRQARAPLILFNDNDTLPVPDLVVQHLDWHSRYRDEEAAVLGHVRWAPELRVTPFMRWLDQGVQFDYPNIEGIDAGWGRFYTANVSVKRSFVERLDGFDEERLPYRYEDLDFAYRASKFGLRVLYNRRAVVDHLRPMTLEYYRGQIRRTAAAEWRFTRLHPEIQPYFHRMFSHAASLPRASGRGIRLARWVPRWVPWLGPRVWTSVDISYKQALAPDFLEAWEQAAADDEPVQAEPSAPEAESSAGRSSSGPK